MPRALDLTGRLDVRGPAVIMLVNTESEFAVCGGLGCTALLRNAVLGICLL
jgi:hypothetical protein